MLNFKHYFQEILTEGGAAGHMDHPFNLPNVRTGSDLVNFFINAANILATEPGSLKIDGVNISFKLIKHDDNTREFAIDRGSMKDLDVQGVTIDKLHMRFPHAGMIKAGEVLLTIFNSALPLIKQELKELGMWNNSKLFFNTEFVEGTTNVQKYADNFLAIHGVNKFKQATPRRRESEEVPYKKSVLEALIAKINPIANQRDFMVYHNIPASLDNMPDFDKILDFQIPIFINDDVIEKKKLKEWLRTAVNPRDQKVPRTNGGKVSAMSKEVYLAIINGTKVNTITNDDHHNQKLCIDGAIFYHATRLLGDEILRHITSPLGRGTDNEGIVLRNKKLSSKPVKITGNFIVSGLESAFSS